MCQAEPLSVYAGRSRPGQTHLEQRRRERIMAIQRNMAASGKLSVARVADVDATSRDGRVLVELGLSAPGRNLVLVNVSARGSGSDKAQVVGGVLKVRP